MTQFQKKAKGIAVVRRKFFPRESGRTEEKMSVRKREVWILTGQISAGKRRTNDVSRFTRVLETKGESQARSWAFRELYSIAKKKKEASRGSNILFEEVSLRKGKLFIPLEPEYANKRFLSATPGKVFGRTVVQ
jgi:hypothetical protein